MWEQKNYQSMGTCYGIFQKSYVDFLTLWLIFLFPSTYLPITILI